MNQSQGYPSGQPLGALKISYVIYFYHFIILITPAYTYYMAVKHQQQKPFPHATVTDTACHYPQAQFFRWTMTSAGCFLSLIFHIVFRWFQMQARKYQYPGNSYSYMYWPSMLSIFGYLAAIGTIDIGGTGNFHSIGAVYFFVILYFMVANFTIIAYKMRRWDTRIISRGSLAAKIVVAGYLSIIWVYCIFGLISGLFQGRPNDDETFIVIIEWNLVYAGLVWILCLLPDLKDVYIELNPKSMRMGLCEGNSAGLRT